MKIYSLTSVLILTALSQTAFAEKSEDNSGVSAQVRLGHTTTEDGAGNSVSTTAIGGSLGAISPIKNGLSVGGTVYNTSPIGADDDGLFLSSDGNGYSIVGEAWVQAEFANTAVKVGRQAIDTPFADTDHIGMIPNTFQGVVVSNTSLPNTTIVGMNLDKWAGVDAATPEKFTDINGSNGVQAIGAIYENDKWGGQLWYYNQKNATDITYLELGTSPVKNLDVGLQYTTQKDNAGSGKGNAWGAMAAYAMGDFTIEADYNKASGTNGVINGFGGGPYFTSAENNTIDGTADISAKAIGIEYTGIDKLTLVARKVNFDQGVGDELDLVAAYKIKDNLTADLIYSDMNADGKNTRFFVNYSFNL